MPQWEYAFLTLERAVYDQDTGPKAKLTYTHSDDAEEIAGSQFRSTIRRLGDEGWEAVRVRPSQRSCRGSREHAEPAFRGLYATKAL